MRLSSTTRTKARCNGAADKGDKLGRGLWTLCAHRALGITRSFRLWVRLSLAPVMRGSRYQGDGAGGFRKQKPLVKWLGDVIANT